MERKVMVYIAMSLDGYIAKPNNDLSFLNAVQTANEDYGYGAFMQSVDTVIIGRNTYNWVMTQAAIFPHSDMTTYVITHEKRGAQGKTIFYNNDLSLLIQSLRRQAGKHIFVDGGANIIQQLMQQNLIDELIISIIPVILGEGVRLFNGPLPEQTLQLLHGKYFASGLVQLHYSAVEKAQE